MISKTFLGKIKLFVSYIKLYEIKDSIKFSVCFVSYLIYIFFKKPAHSDHFRKWSLITVSLQNDHLSITTTFLWSQKWSLYTGLTVIYKNRVATNFRNLNSRHFPGFPGLLLLIFQALGLQRLHNTIKRYTIKMLHATIILADEKLV